MAEQTITYLKSKFEKGDFPDQNDFHDLLDSCYNFSLSNQPEDIAYLASVSGNWEQTYQVVDAKRYSWDEAVSKTSFLQAASSTLATKSNLTNYLNLTGGTVGGNLSVIGSILSGSTDLRNIFLTPSNYQNLTYNESNYGLAITQGNTVSLSSLRSSILIQFTHDKFNPTPNSTLFVGQFSQIPPSTSPNNSYSYKSMFKGVISEVTLQNYFDNGGSSETHSLHLVNKTQGLSSLLANNIRYTTSLVDQNTSLTNNLLSLPSGWTPNQVNVDPDGLRFENENSSLVTSNISGTTNFTSLSVFFSGKSSTLGGIFLNVLDQNNNILTNQIDFGLFSFNFSLASAQINLPTSSDTLKLRFASTASVIIKDLNVFGRFPTDTRLQHVVLNNSGPSSKMNVNYGDVLEIRLITPSSYVSNPTNVINTVNAKFDITG